MDIKSGYEWIQKVEHIPSHKTKKKTKLPKLPHLITLKLSIFEYPFKIFKINIYEPPQRHTVLRLLFYLPHLPPPKKAPHNLWLPQKWNTS